MASSLREDDHYVLRKLYHEVLPWMIAGRKGRKQWFVAAATVYAYGGEIATAMAGVGIGSPLISAVSGKGQAQVFEEISKSYTGIFFWTSVVVLAVWLVLRITISRENAVARALYANDCANAMCKLYADLNEALAGRSPMEKINTIQLQVMKSVRDAIDRGVWRYDPPTKFGNDVRDERDTYIDEIRSSFMNDWDPPPTGAA